MNFVRASQRPLHTATIIIISLLCIAPAFADEDIAFWQGQYYSGSTFHQGTYEFNFTVFDARVSGNVCYTNVTTITTGPWGEWNYEPYGVNAACNNASRDYWLLVSIDGTPQLPMRYVNVGHFLRADSPIEINQSVHFTGNVSSMSQDVVDLIAWNTLNVLSDTNSYHGGLTIQNQNSGPLAATTLYISNDEEQLVSLAIASSNYSALPPNSGGLLYEGNATFVFANRNDSTAWVWASYFLEETGSGPDFHLQPLLRLVQNGTLELFGGAFDLYGGSILNANSISTVDFESTGDASFESLYSTELIAETIEADDIEVNNDICLPGGKCLSTTVNDQSLSTDDDVTFNTLNTTSVTVANDVCITGGNCLSNVTGGGGAGNPFDQELNTTHNVTFAELNATTLTTVDITSTGDASFESLYSTELIAETIEADDIAINNDICLPGGKCLSTAINDQSLNTDDDVSFGTVTTASLYATTTVGTTMNATVVNANAYAADDRVGITDNSTYHVCRSAEVGGTCLDPCVLDIQDGLIVGCN
jgi:hypothetical protein